MVRDSNPAEVCVCMCVLGMGPEFGVPMPPEYVIPLPPEFHKIELLFGENQLITCIYRQKIEKNEILKIGIRTSGVYGSLRLGVRV